MRLRTLFIAALAALAAAGPLAAAPQLLTHQGRLLDAAGAPLEGTVDLTFTLYLSSTGAEAVWLETFQDVAVQGGLFSVLLGGQSPLDDPLFEQDLWLGVRVGSDSELTPRLRLSSVPFAFRARHVDHLSPGNVTELLALLNSLPDADGDGHTGVRFGGDDCDDRDAQVHPGAQEVCDGLDNDCDGTVDDGFDAYWWYPDADGDGYGVGPAGRLTCSPPAGWVMVDGDCDDGDSGSHPGAEEVCDERDNDCDGLVDNNASTGDFYYYDEDQDGYGAGAGVRFCSPPLQYWAWMSGDCDNANANVWPGAPEVCDNQDNNCNGQADEGISQMWYPDNDGDGWGADGSGIWACEMPWGPYTATGGDCDDSNSSVWPGSAEICGDSVDNNCDGQVDEFCP